MDKEIVLVMMHGLRALMDFGHVTTVGIICARQQRGEM